MAARLVLTTCPDAANARRIARALVERRLAACVTCLPGVVSVYRWRGAIEETDEVQMLIKTTAAREAGLVAAIGELHPYEEPEIVTLAVAGGSPAYLDWIAATTDEDA